MFSVLFQCGNEILKLGPFATEKAATDAAKQAQANKSFDIRDRRVYLIDTGHVMTEFSMADLLDEDDDEDEE